jgi:hypothetical protein
MRDAVEEREPLYASVAEITLDTGSGSPEAAARELAGRLRDHPSCR